MAKQRRLAPPSPKPARRQVVPRGKLPLAAAVPPVAPAVVRPPREEWREHCDPVRARVFPDRQTRPAYGSVGEAAEALWCEVGILLNCGEWLLVRRCAYVDFLQHRAALRAWLDGAIPLLVESLAPGVPPLNGHGPEVCRFTASLEDRLVVHCATHSDVLMPLLVPTVGLDEQALDLLTLQDLEALLLTWWVVNGSYLADLEIATRIAQLDACTGSASRAEPGASASHAGLH